MAHAFHTKWLWLVVLWLVALTQAIGNFDHWQSPRQRPNIVMIISDDQDYLLNSLDYQPVVRKEFGDQGTFFARHYCTIAQCCPSRVSLLTGKAAHNTNITDVRLPYGGYQRFVQQGLNGEWLPSWMQSAGYNTYYVGKLMNDHNVQNYNNPYPQGFNSTDFLLDPGTYLYYNATMQSNKDVPRSIAGTYSTDAIASRAGEFMELAHDETQPFFLVVAPIGPHGQTVFPGTADNPSTFPLFQAPVPAVRHKDLYQGIQIPRTDSFNTDTVNSPSYRKRIPQWNQTVIDYYDEFYRLRLRTLAAVDDLVTSIFDKAAALNIMDKTIFIYTSDNGFHIGQHRMPAGKSCAIEEDIHVPFFMRGPGIAKNLSIDSPTSHTDIAPTLFKLAHISPRDDFDGISMPIHGINADQPGKQEHVNVEFWGSNIPEGRYGTSLMPASNNNTYKALRLISNNGTFDVSYMVWCTNEHELYDNSVDPGQINNLAITWTAVTQQSSERAQDFSDPAYVKRVQSRLDTLLMVLKTCKAQSCTHPWTVMHPDGSVQSLKDAMDPKYDSCYANQIRISFVGCAQGYLRGLEGPGADQGNVQVCSA